MAGETYIIAGIEEDSEASILTLGILRERIEHAIADGVPEDTRVTEGYSPQLLRSCLHVVKPVDLKEASLSALLGYIQSGPPEERSKAGAEIQRRIDEGSETAEHLALEGKA